MLEAEPNFKVLNNMQILYRISNNSYRKRRLPEATKEYCLNNFIANVLTSRDNLFIVGDNVEPNLREFLRSKDCDNIKFIDQQFGSNGASFRFQLELAASFDQQECVLLQEDDYLYKSAKWPFEIETSYSQMFGEALKFADYASMYDHPDKYISPSHGGNKFVSSDGVEQTGIFCTEHSHWKYTNSTTCTFASKAGTISRDLKIWMHFCSGDHPHDFQAFTALALKGRTLATSIPGRATHTELDHISPFFEKSM